MVHIFFAQYLQSFARLRLVKNSISGNKKVMSNILNKLRDKTMIVIAHRLETIKDVDNIFVLSDGKIVEEGKYQDLLDKNGYFDALYKSSK